jgi:group I intron endonuclease
MIIYKVTNLLNSKIYIGLTIQKLETRKHQHELHSQKKPLMVLHYAIRKYGKENFKWEIIKECISNQELNSSEKELIKFFQSEKKDIGYNRTSGGENPKMSIEVRLKMSKSQSKRFADPIKNKEFCEAMKGHKPISQEAREKISKKNKINTKEYWKNLDPESYKKRVEKISQTIKLKYLNGTIKKRSKKILQFDLNDNLIQEWESIHLAQKTLNINNICKALKNGTPLKNFKWKYK